MTRKCAIAGGRRAMRVDAEKELKKLKFCPFCGLPYRDKDMNPLEYAELLEKHAEKLKKEAEEMRKAWKELKETVEKLREAAREVEFN